MTPYTLNIRTRGRLSLLLLLSVMALCFPLSGSAADDDEKSERENFSKKKNSVFEIKKALWENDDGQLKIKGRYNRPGADIIIRNAKTNVLLGTATVRKSRKWKLKALIVDTVPCRIEAQAGDEIQQKEVEGAPANCDESPPVVDDPNLVSHAGFFDAYEGSKTCNQCHLETARHVHDSLHYQWNGPAPYAVNLERGGKLGSINDFCGYPDINFIGQQTNLEGETVDGGCAVCHVGRGMKPAPEQTAAQLENIDCLVCHSNTYKRKVAQVDGEFRFVPAPEKMQVSMLDAITTIQRTPDKDTCINCHAYAGGGCNNKRGDLEEAHRNAPRWFDVHLASRQNGGAGLHCINCHVTENHRIAGRGTDMQATDLDVPVRCTNCHDDKPHDSSDLNRHTARVDCTVCHIPAFARITSTDMFRDFSQPAEVHESAQLYEPHIDRAANVTPKYRFFNGFSRFYKFSTPAIPGESGRVVMSEPIGDVTDSDAKLFAFKHHLALQARDRDTQYLIPLKMGVLFQTGDVDAATRQGASEVGWPLASGYDFVPTERYMGIFHEVAPADDALECNDCHADSGRIDFSALGYTPVSQRNGVPLCTSCHESESEWSKGGRFRSVHKKHVKQEGIDCIACHIFTSAG